MSILPLTFVSISLDSRASGVMDSGVCHQFLSMRKALNADIWNAIKDNMQKVGASLSVNYSAHTSEFTY